MKSTCVFQMFLWLLVSEHFNHSKLEIKYKFIHGNQAYK